MTTCALHIRIPAQIKRWLAGEAKRNERSINAQTVYLLRQEMDKEKASEPAVGSNSDANNDQ